MSREEYWSLFAWRVLVLAAVVFLSLRGAPLPLALSLVALLPGHRNARSREGQDDDSDSDLER
jgi:hypothetical protein